MKPDIQDGPTEPRAAGPRLALLIGVIGLVLMIAAIAISADWRVGCAEADRSVRDRLGLLVPVTGDSGAVWAPGYAPSAGRAERKFCNGHRPEQGFAAYRRALAALDTLGTSGQPGIRNGFRT